MIFFIHTTRICTEECKLEEAAVVIACSLRHVSSMFNPRLATCFRINKSLFASVPVIQPESNFFLDTLYMIAIITLILLQA